MGRFFLLCSFILGLLTCAYHSPQALIGSWKANLVLEEGDTLDMDLRNVTLHFSEDQRFKYKHTQLDSLAGIFDIHKGLINLYVDKPSSDTIIIQLSDLTESSMTLRMNHEGKERLVTMIK